MKEETRVKIGVWIINMTIFSFIVYILWYYLVDCSGVYCI